MILMQNKLVKSSLSSSVGLGGPSELNQILGVLSKISEPTFHTPTQQDSTEEEQHVDEGSHSPIMLDTDEEEQL